MDAYLQRIIELGMQNFSLAMLVVAIIAILIHKMVSPRTYESEIVFRWIAFFTLGLVGIYTFILHAFFPVISAAAIGWLSSPFQYEVAMADLSLGVLGLCSFRASYGFRLATVIASICFLWGDATGHMYQMIAHHNFSVGNAGSWFITDLIVPLILLICLPGLKKHERQV